VKSGQIGGLELEKEKVVGGEGGLGDKASERSKEKQERGTVSCLDEGPHRCAGTGITLDLA